MGNTFGHLFRITTFGESHGGAVGVVIDGCPPRVPIGVEEIQAELDRRRPGQSKLVTQRRESDTVHILSGVFEGKTLGTPICLLVWNEDARPEAYEHFRELYRPSHADYTYDAKYGIRDWRGGGRSSARETVGRVAAGAIAKKVLRQVGVQIVGWVEKIQSLRAQVDPDTVTIEAVEANPVRCPVPEVAEAMAQAIEQARRQGDSLGGVVGCVARGVPSGWGDPVFDKLDADLARAMLSIPAAKGFEIGSGFAGTDLTGSQHNDPFYVDEHGNVRTRTNHSGGVQGGISNGENIVIRVAFKPTATIMLPQETVSVHRDPAVLTAKGRHDPCVLPRAVPIVEAMMALVLVDHYLRHRAQCGGEG
jgi:chorismate synthase